jgi:SAM domain (Sterile alpha motif)
MSEYLLQKNFEEWSAQELALYFKQKTDLDSNYAELLEKQKVDGKVAPQLTEEDLKQMGIDTVGDRKRVMAAIETLKKAKAMNDRSKVLWEGEEVMYISCWQWCCETCCGCCPQDPEIYTLLYNHLSIKKPNKNRCGPCVCCCGHSYEIDNIDLSNIQDVDVEGIPPPCIQQCCCGAKTQEHLKIQTSNDSERIILKLQKGTGQEVARKIKNQVEVMQRMERN